MKVIFASTHGHSKRVAQKFEQAQNVIDNPTLDDEVTLFICPTYGDEELHLDMEDFLQNMTATDQMFVICELGNYYGYDDFEFGVLKIIKGHLEAKGWKQFFPSLSLDSMPEIDWETFEEWKGKLNEALQSHSENL